MPITISQLKSETAPDKISFQNFAGTKSDGKFSAAPACQSKSVVLFRQTESDSRFGIGD